MKTGFAVMGSVMALLTACVADMRVNADSQVVADFARRVADYQKMEKTLEDQLPKLKVTGSPFTIEEHQEELAQAIRGARRAAASGATQGTIFTPSVGAEFRRLIGLAMEGANAARIRKSLRDAEPVQFQLQVNASYPSAVPRQSTPPTLLLNLPPLPQDLEYRFLGATLILLDTKANLVVDLMPDAIR